MSTIYLGKPLKAGQQSAPELALRDVNLSRIAPSDLHPVILPETIQPLHAVYTKYLNVYCAAAYDNAGKKLTEPFIPFPSADLTTFFRNPRIIWSYSARLTNDQIDTIKVQFSAEEVEIKGKPAFLARLTPAEIRVLAAATPSPLHSTPANERCMNISGYRSYVLASRVINCILRVNQYAYQSENSSDDVDEDNYYHQLHYARFLVSENAIPVASGEGDDGMSALLLRVDSS